MVMVECCVISTGMPKYSTGNKNDKIILSACHILITTSQLFCMLIIL